MKCIKLTIMMILLALFFSAPLASAQNVAFFANKVLTQASLSERWIVWPDFVVPKYVIAVYDTNGNGYLDKGKLYPDYGNRYLNVVAGNDATPFPFAIGRGYEGEIDDYDYLKPGKKIGVNTTCADLLIYAVGYSTVENPDLVLEQATFFGEHGFLSIEYFMWLALPDPNRPEGLGSKRKECEGQKKFDYGFGYRVRDGLSTRHFTGEEMHITNNRCASPNGPASCSPPKVGFVYDTRNSVTNTNCLVAGRVFSRTGASADPASWPRTYWSSVGTGDHFGVKDIFFDVPYVDETYFHGRWGHGALDEPSSMFRVGKDSHPAPIQSGYQDKCGDNFSPSKVGLSNLDPRMLEPKTVMAWSDDMMDYENNTAGFYDESQYGTIQYPDVNGDGKDDVCGRFADGIRCGVAQGGLRLEDYKFGTTELWADFFGDWAGWGSHPSYWKTIQFADLNGDDKDDVCGRLYYTGLGGTETGVYCALSDGQSFGPVSLWTTFFGGGPTQPSPPWWCRYSYYKNSSTCTVPKSWGADPAYWETITLVDMDADGKADICGRYEDGIHCAKSSGSSFLKAKKWSRGNDFADGVWNTDPSYYKTIRFVNVNSRRYLETYAETDDFTGRMRQIH